MVKKNDACFSRFRSIAFELRYQPVILNGMFANGLKNKSTMAVIGGIGGPRACDCVSGHPKGSRKKRYDKAIPIT